MLGSGGSPIFTDPFASLGLRASQSLLKGVFWRNTPPDRQEALGVVFGSRFKVSSPIGGVGLFSYLPTYKKQWFKSSNHQWATRSKVNLQPKVAERKTKISPSFFVSFFPFFFLSLSLSLSLSLHRPMRLCCCWVCRKTRGKSAFGGGPYIHPYTDPDVCGARNKPHTFGGPNRSRST